jgi:hypothetical protein
MTLRAFWAVLAMIAGFVVSAPSQPDVEQQHAAATAILQAVHLPSAATRSASGTVQQAGFIGHAPVDLTPRARPTLPLRVLLDVAQRVHRTPESVGFTPLGDRAPPLTSV